MLDRVEAILAYLGRDAPAVGSWCPSNGRLVSPSPISANGREALGGYTQIYRSSVCSTEADTRECGYRLQFARVCRASRTKAVG